MCGGKKKKELTILALKSWHNLIFRDKYHKIDSLCSIKLYTTDVEIITCQVINSRK